MIWFLKGLIYGTLDLTIDETIDELMLVLNMDN